MSSIPGRLSVAAGTLLIVLMLSMPVHGQALLAGGGINPGSAASTTAYVPPVTAGTTLPNPFFPSYYPSYYGTWGGYLMGVSSVYQSQGQYQIDSAKGKILNEKALQDRVDTRRKIFDQWMYERNSLPSLQDMREKELKNRLRRALTDPPVQEVTSGQSLNTLLEQAGRAVLLNPAAAPTIPLSPNVVKSLNVAVDPASGNGLGAIKALRDGKQLDWPVTLMSAEYNGERKSIDDMLREAVDDAAKAGKVNVNTLQKIQMAYLAMAQRLEEDINHLTPDQYFAGRRFLGQLNGSIKALQQKDVDKYFGRLDKVRTVTQLVQEMNGCTFAPAADGDAAAYLAVQQALAAFVMQVQANLPPEK
jgi:hypothetical protein